MKKNRISILSPLVIISPSLGQAPPEAMRLSYPPNSVNFAPSSSSSVTILLLFPSLASALDDLYHLYTLLLPSLLLLVNPEPNPVLLHELVREVIQKLRWGTWPWLLSDWNLNKRNIHQISRLFFKINDKLSPGCFLSLPHPVEQETSVPREYPNPC